MSSSTTNSHLIEVRDRSRLAAFLKRDLPLHIYEVGDLDPLFWPDTRWFAWERDGALSAVSLLYSGLEVPTLLLLERTNVGDAALLLAALRDVLPTHLYAHLSPELDKHLPVAGYTSLGLHHKMTLKSHDALASIDTAHVEALGPEHTEELVAFYAESYPGNWFMPRMLSTAEYVGVRSGSALQAVAGVHVVSPELGVAALGNITTLPNARGQGLGRVVTARVCQSLLRRVTTIGLNVHAENQAAIRCYRALGFEIVASYNELVVDPLRD